MNKYEKAFIEIGEAYDGKIKLKYMNDIFELVERATPKKVIRIKGYIPKCPNCNHFQPFAIEKRNHCHKCGQTLNWTN